MNRVLLGLGVIGLALLGLVGGLVAQQFTAASCINVTTAAFTTFTVPDVAATDAIISFSNLSSTQGVEALFCAVGCNTGAAVAVSGPNPPPITVHDGRTLTTMRFRATNANGATVCAQWAKP